MFKATTCSTFLTFGVFHLFIIIWVDIYGDFFERMLMRLEGILGQYMINTDKKGMPLLGCSHCVIRTSTLSKTLRCSYGWRRFYQ